MWSRSRILRGTKVSVRFDSEREDSLSLRLTTYEISSDYESWIDYVYLTCSSVSLCVRFELLSSPRFTN